jgi:hypothetical protein
LPQHRRVPLILVHPSGVGSAGPLLLHCHIYNVLVDQKHFLRVPSK